MPSLQLRRGLAANRTSVTPAEGELIFTTDTSTLYVGDGTTPGGVVVAGQTQGTVTSVAVSGGSTGLTTSGGPITGTGTITLAGTLEIANGGTGQTTAGSAFNALAPSQDGNTGKYLTTNGTTTSWASVDALPSQTGNTGKVLVTNGTTASWVNETLTNQIYVTNGGNDTTGDGSLTNPFLTIGAALAYIDTTYPVTPSSATHIAIHIAPGNYTENITITRPCTHLFGPEGKLKSVMINGSIVINPSTSYQGIFQTNITLNDLFINGTSGDAAVNLAGTVQCSLDINSCYIFSDSTRGFYVTSTASGGNRIRVYNTDVTTTSTSVTLDISNTTNCVISYMLLSSASTTNAINLSGNITLSLVQASTATTNNVISVTSGTINIAYCAISNTKANGNGITIAAGATVVAVANTYNVVAGTGKAVTGSAGSVYVRGGNYYVFGTNSGIGATVTTLNMQGEVAGTDIISTVPSSVGGTGLTTFGAANRAIYSTSASALTAGTLPVAAGGTGGTSASTARAALSAAASGANSDITSITGLTTALSEAQGGTAQTTWATGDLLYASGSNTLSKLGVGSTNQVLTVVGGVPTWAAGGSSAADTLTGTTLASNVVSSSLTSVGTLSSLAISGAITFGTNYTETRTSITAAATTDINCGLSNIFTLTMSASIGTLTFSNIPNSGRAYNMSLFVNQDATGGRTITWPASVKWPSGTAPTLTTTASKTDILNLVTHDGGTTWYGFVAGQNY